MDEYQLRKLIDRVSNNFEDEVEIKVDESGREALVKPAVPHLPQVNRELDSRRITVRFLEGTVDVVLHNAVDDWTVRRYRRIDGAAVERSIAKYCPYLFWC